MRSSVSMSKFTFAVFVCALLLPVAIHAAGIHPVERHLRERFPSLAIDSSASFDASDAVVNGRIVSGLRVAGGGLLLRVTYPRLYDEPLVAELGSQRVVLRAVGARGAAATESGGKLVYERMYESTDAIEVPHAGRSEELLLLHDRGAPLIYEYEIVELQGIGAVVLDEGAVRFQPAAAAIPTTTGRFSQPGPWLQIDRPWVIDASGRRSESHARWTLVRDGDVPKTLRLTVSAEGLSYPLVVDPSFSFAGSLANARYSHTSTLLQNGLVLFAGGADTAPLSSAELYDPGRGTFRATGSLGTGRYGHTATALPNGKVLIAGGQGSAGYLSSAELYDPATGTFSATGNLFAPRSNHTANALPDGRVLLAGGFNDTTGYLTSAELYNPVTGTSSVTGSLAIARSQHAATLLPSGKVLLAGGYNGAFLSSAEVFDPSSGSNGMFSATGPLAAARYGHSATLLLNGKVLIAGGSNGPYLTSAELYDPSGAGGTGSFSGTGPLATGRYVHTATLLPNGKVLITGGLGGPVLSSAELYDPVAGTFSDAGNLILGRYYHTATLLPNGRILIAGGLSGFTISNVELYDSASPTFTATGSMTSPRSNFTATLLSDGKVLLAAGEKGSGMYSDTAERYDPISGTSTATGTMVAARFRYKATLLPNGKVLLVGGNSPSLTAELFDPGTGMFTATGNMTIARQAPTATLLTNGKVLITGGYSGPYTRTAELYDPGTGVFTATGDMTVARGDHVAKLLPDGKVLIAGGYTGVLLNTAELYDPTTGTFAATGNMTVPRFNFTATLLPNGKVLMVGGESTGGTFVNTAELYDLASGTFSATGSMSAGRHYHTATLMPNGRVLIAGGYNSTALNTAELYDTATGLFTPAATMTTARGAHTATLLPNGKVLMAGGSITGSILDTAELYDVGLGYADSRRPVIGSAPAILAQPGAITLTGSDFLGDTEGSSGGYQSSATNYPLLQLQRVDNDQLVFVNASAWSDTGFTSTALSTLADGPYRVTIFASAIPSLQRVIVVTGVAPPAAPTLLSATATSTTTVAVTWAPVEGAAFYELYESELGVGYALILRTTATSYVHSLGIQPDITYLYKVRAIGYGGPSGPSAADAATTVMFTDPSLGGVVIQLVHLVEVRRAIAAMRVAASLPSMNFTDPMPMAGTVSVKAVHITELRSGLDEARAVIGLPPWGYTDLTITPGSTLVKAAHMMELRAGTQ